MSSSSGRRPPLAVRLRTALLAALVLALAVVSGASDAGPSRLSEGPVQGDELRQDVRDVAVSAVSRPAVVALGETTGRGVARPVHGVGAAGGGTVASIPSVALQAYQRAGWVMDEAAPRCRLHWTLLAAVGRVESDHGRSGGSVLDDDGTSSPAIVGAPLDGAGRVPVVRDTDAGVVDGDRVWDRAVGPLQLLPSTWNAVAVDGDGDGERSVHDVDDAALAAAVFLCTVRSRLDEPGNARAALLRYNRSRAYVSRVMSFARRYAADDAAAVTSPDSYPGGPVLALPEVQPEVRPGPSGGSADGRSSKGGASKKSGAGAATKVDPDGPAPSATGSAGADAPTSPAPSETSNAPTPEPSGGGGATPGAGPTSSAGPSPATASPTPDAVTPPPATATPPPATGTPQPSTPPDPTPPPSPQVVEGLWTGCGDGRCLDGTPLVLGGPDPACRLHDYDGDGAIEASTVELEGLAGQSVTLTVLTDPGGWLVLEIRGLVWVSSPSSCTPPPR